MVLYPEQPARHLRPAPGPRTCTSGHQVDHTKDTAGKTFSEHVARAARGLKKVDATNAVADIQAELLRALRSQR